MSKLRAERIVEGWRRAPASVSTIASDGFDSAMSTLVPHTLM